MMVATATATPVQLTASEQARRTALTITAALGFLVAGYLLALFVVHGMWVSGQPPQIAAGFNAFALLFVMALAIERLIQPLAPGLGPNSNDAKAQLRAAKASKNDAGIETAQAALADARNKTAVVTWGLATGLSCLLAAACNVTLLHAITNPTGPQAGYWVDLLVTGLAVGAGTKPLNDLWTRLQNK